MFDHRPLVVRLRAACAMIAAVLLAGTLGYVLVEQWSLIDSFYMTVITLTTVGYSEPHQLSMEGRLFTTALIFVSVVGMSLWTASLTSLFIEGDLTGTFSRKRAKKMAASLHNHTIVCGSGTMAQSVVHELTRREVPVVVVDDDVATLEWMRRKFPKVTVIQAAATEELALCDANVLHAKNVVAALASDFDNLLIAMTCKDLGTDIKVVARSNDVRIASRMLKVGVDSVICPYQLSGQRAAELITATAPE